MTRSNQDKTDQIIQRIVREYKPEKIYLFGSEAWGNPGPDKARSYIRLPVEPNNEQ
ncbi:MAG: hypothetical protein HY978_00920 [Candidatus Liptonbacteria bacterium]|nr:hypothetical protein [Candidatus Liptonbacteria bacterium]